MTGDGALSVFLGWNIIFLAEKSRELQNILTSLFLVL